jgi:hypothetical protein
MVFVCFGNSKFFIVEATLRDLRIRFPMEVTVWTYSREEVARFVLREEAGGLSPELRILES